MRISDWSSDVCSSDLQHEPLCRDETGGAEPHRLCRKSVRFQQDHLCPPRSLPRRSLCADAAADDRPARRLSFLMDRRRSEEHTSELQSLMRTSYAVFCLKKKKDIQVNS